MAEVRGFEPPAPRRVLSFAGSPIRPLWHISTVHKERYLRIPVCPPLPKLALLYLAGAGVGRISLFDDHVVSPSNLHRQVIHTTAAIGTSKTDSAAAAVRALNPEVDITCHGRLESATALEQLRGCDLILDGTDNFDARYLSSWAAHELGIPHVWASILGIDAQLSVFWSGHGPVYVDVFPTAPAPGEVPSCSQAGVLVPVVGVVGSAMALEALKLITGVGTPIIGTLGYFDALSST